MAEKLKNILIILLILTSLSLANILTVTNSNGTIYKSIDIQHKNNKSLEQKATAYSVQAIYDEIYYARKIAIKAQKSKEIVSRIEYKQEEAKRVGKIYSISDSDKHKLSEYAKYYKGGKYIWGGTTPNGFDCSGYVQYLYQKYDIALPRTALAQSKEGILVSRDNLQKGDLVFFLTDRSRGISITHVGIYIGGGDFIHASSKKRGVIISSLIYGRYAGKFVLARRVIKL